MTPSAVIDAVDGERLWARLHRLARHGARPDGGVDRPALSPAEIEAKRELVAWGEELGLRPFSDVLGNLFLRLDGAADGPPVLLGSHLDSQPTGGRYDGTYGVLAALEAVAALRRAGVRPAGPVEIVAWTNEEGSRFAPGMTGSAGYAGARPLAALLALRDAAGASVADEVAALRRALPLPERPLGRPARLYIEPHIEQGLALEAAGVPVGVVTGMQGKRTFRVRVEGRAAHAGTTPRRERRDALLAAAHMVVALEAATADPDDLVRFTVGRFAAEPNAPSVIAQAAEFSVDLRHPDEEALRHLGDAVAPVCRAAAGPCVARIEELSTAWPQAFDAGLRVRLHEAAALLDIAAVDLASAAGHDARYLAPLCPAAMLFIPCRGGVTHHPDEAVEPAHATAGARVLAAALAALVLPPDGSRRGAFAMEENTG
jgi:N-carbamoyl-L-amino-acid hydrolase